MQVFVRVNSVASEWFEADIAEGLVAGLAGVVVPKIESTHQIDRVAEALRRAGYSHFGILAGIETALG